VWCVGIAGATETASCLFPTFSLARLIKITSLPIIERQDALFMVFWVAAMLLKITAFFFAGVLCLSQWCNLRDFRPIIIPSMILVMALARYNWKSIVDLFKFSEEVFPLSTLSINFFLTLILLLVAHLKGFKPR